MASKKKEPIPYVGRGGIKLAHALKIFQIPVQRQICLDVGSSTGGFTDCLLQHGAKQVYAVDVGYNQLDYKLRIDTRVVVMERTHVMRIMPDQFPCKFSLITVDVSFISLKNLLEHLMGFLETGGSLLGLIKPNFEVGKEKIGKKGVVRKTEWHVEAIDSVLAMAKSLGLEPVGLTYSPLKGPEGNIEYFAWLKRCQEPFLGDAQKTVNSAQVVVDEAVRVLGMPGKHNPPLPSL